MPENNKGTFKSRSWTAGLFLAGILLLIAGVIDMVFLAPPSGRAFSSALVSMGTVLVIISGLRLWRGEKDSFQDERTRKIGAYGLSWSWFLTFIALFAIFLSDCKGFWSPGAGTLSVLLILLMGISARAFQLYLFRRGDED